MDSALSNELQALHSNVVSYIVALELLGQLVNLWDAWLETVLLRKFDHAPGQEWQLRRNHMELLTYADLEAFISRRFIAFENTEIWNSRMTETEKNITIRIPENESHWSPQK